tara:strand:+ start:417 stop:632 length:216 start_codon:yes stop_codon:yes gene_type:complete
MHYGIFVLLLPLKIFLMIITWAFAFLGSYLLRQWGLAHQEAFIIRSWIVWTLLFLPSLLLGFWFVLLGFRK